MLHRRKSQGLLTGRKILWRVFAILRRVVKNRKTQRRVAKCHKISRTCRGKSQGHVAKIKSWDFADDTSSGSHDLSHRGNDTWWWGWVDAVWCTEWILVSGAVYDLGQDGSLTPHVTKAFKILTDLHCHDFLVNLVASYRPMLAGKGPEQYYGAYGKSVGPGKNPLFQRKS